MNYYSKLRRITSSMFPHLVPDRYRELMRVARQWWQLKLLKWNGFGHDRRDPKDGELALFCPACPQPGINVTLPTQDDETTPGWLYSRSLVMDGNFKAEHLHPAHPEDKVWLTNGKSFMVARARVVNQANTSRHKLEATGIGGCACARHGCFMPNSMVDFQKGERQMNMDYALCNTLSHNMDGLHRALIFYDVNCQYNKHLWQRVDESLHLSIPPGMDIIPGIGLWHVHGHQDKCYVRYASNFILGAARIDGEIMETLWAPLNIISPSAQGMSTPHRQECLDYQMNDCNFMKMIRMDPEMVEWWEAQEGAAQASRMNDPSALDLYDVQLQKGKSGLFWDIMAVEVEVELLQTSFHQPGARPQLGAVTWLASGITIEEMQIALAMETRRMGRHPTETQMLEIGRRRIRLQHSINEFVAAAGKYRRGGYDADDHIPDMDIEFLDDGPDGGASTDEDIEDVWDPGDNCPKGLFRPEMVVIPLPSNLGIYRCEELGAARLVRQETTLREGQANDMLHAIRVHLADKAVLFRTTVRPAKSQARTTRAWAQVHSVEQVINLNSMIYKKCRAQLSNLGADQLLEKYWVLEKSDLKATSAVADPNARGQRNSTLPWFWSLDIQGDSVSNDWMNEFYRVHWLRTKALRDRWEEEILLVGHEMRWTIDFLVHRSRTWLSQANQNGDLPGVGSITTMLYPSLIFQPNSVPVSVSLWDATRIFEYATSCFTTIRLALDKNQRFVFPFINICVTSNTCPALPEYLNDIVMMFTHWQSFHTHNFNVAGDLMACYRIINNYSYSWWKDWFDLLPFEMPNRIPLDEVIQLYREHEQQVPAGYLLLPDLRRHEVGPDPLLTNLHVIKDDLQELGAQLEGWLSRKMDDGNLALDTMTSLEGPVDHLQDVMAASQHLLEAAGCNQHQAKSL
ncbi:hypothetical protein DFH29DRAFT_883337 [Suillus ampliporus]|nr:hypothetical protein DFH29DRAFT_883337 [Suillus ampliporus]